MIRVNDAVYQINNVHTIGIIVSQIAVENDKCLIFNKPPKQDHTFFKLPLMQTPVNLTRVW